MAKKSDAKGPQVGEWVFVTDVERPPGEPARTEKGELNQRPVLRPAQVVGVNEDGSLELIGFGVFSSGGHTKHFPKSKASREEAPAGTKEGAGTWSPFE